MTLRILLRSQDGKFVTGDEPAAWTTFQTDARVFVTARSAEEFARKNKLKGMELLIERENAPAMRVPLPF